ncbi:MAG: protein kinase [Alistipes sp.]
MPLLRQYLATLADSRGLTRTLGEIELCRDAQGRPLVSVGNSAAVFRIRHAGRICALRCYLRPPRHLREIYGTRLLEGELYLYETPTHGVWTDVVLDDWIEGETLDRVVRRAAQAGERTRLHDLAAAFDRLAAELLADERAHGDLKPENIVVGTDGGLHPIDFDAAYLPAFAGERSPELGTAAYQHPARTAELYDERLDDYPAALISTALHALACDPSLLLRHGDADGLLLTPQAIPEDAAYREITALFRRRGRQRQHDGTRHRRGGGARTLRRAGALGLPHAAAHRHSGTLRLRLRLHGGARGRAAGRRLALHRHGGAHGHQLPGVRGRQALPRRTRADRPRRTPPADRPHGSGV